MCRIKKSSTRILLYPAMAHPRIKDLFEKTALPRSHFDPMLGAKIRVICCVHGKEEGEKRAFDVEERGAAK